MKILSCGIEKCTHILLFIAFPLFWLCHNICQLSMMQKEKQHLNILITLPLLFLGKSCGGILELILIKFQSHSRRRKQNKPESFHEVGKIPLIQIKDSLTLRKRYFIIIFLLDIVDIITYYWVYKLINKYNESNAINTKGYLYKYQFKGLEIIPQIIIFKLYLKNTVLYRHQKLSLIMIGISLILIIINAFWFIQKDKVLAIISAQFCAVYILYAFKDVTEKWFMDAKSLSPYRLLFYEGIIGVILMSVLLPMCLFCPFFDFKADRDLFFKQMTEIFTSPLPCILLFLDITLICAYTVSHCKIMEKYTPIHKTVLETLYTFVVVIGVIIVDQNQDKNLLIGYSIATCILFVFCCIYNEIIIVHLCNLHLEVKKEIAKRGNNEIFVLINDDINHLEDEEVLL